MAKIVKVEPPPNTPPKDNGEKKKRIIMSQTDFPRISLEKALAIAQALWDDFAGKSAEPHLIAKSIDMSSTSSTWRFLTGASVAYGLTEGGYNAKEIALTSLGKAIVCPTYEGETAQGLAKAALQPQIMRSFFEKYDKAKFPASNIGENILINLGIPKERVKEALDLIIQNGRLVGFITDTKTGPFVSISGAQPSLRKKDIETDTLDEPEDKNVKMPLEDFARQIASEPQKTEPQQVKEKNNRVYISHGKYKQVVEQLKDIIKFGKYEPVVSVENETASKSVPDKVLDDMRSCFAGVINVHSEGEYLDRQGNAFTKINENVLIEIGAAMALFGPNYILLVQKGVKLPSNLQGLYRCEYEGEKLDYEATMKLLKTFNQFN